LGTISSKFRSDGGRLLHLSTSL